MEETDLSLLSPEKKKEYLFLRQKEILDNFLSKGAITKAQYDKSYNDLKLKMKIED